MKNRLERRYGHRHLHFITCSCYRRRPLLGSKRKRDLFQRILLKRGLVSDPKLWPLSSYRFYQFRDGGLCNPDLEAM